MTDRRLALRAWLLAMSRLEVQLRVEQARARNAMIRAAARAYEKNGHPPSHVFLAHRVRVKGVLDDHYRRTIPLFGQMALKQVKSRRIERKAAQTIYEALVAEWIGREALRKATLIADTDRDDVLGAIEGGMAEGIGTEEIGRRIRKVAQMTPYRAATVARTETHAAATFGSIESVRQAERDLGVVMVKEWLATKDDRTRPEHLAADGQKVGMDEKFTVGGELMDRPGDSSASAENVIACRCALVYEEKS
ncbi:phage minor head protein [Tautonia marina]|uniref:phage minor head protein n=1 Tax=Tautonia marina TaxID=2653855 RepID=UPI00191C1101|nr:phage minor head protein [Tautonia marina]